MSTIIHSKRILVIGSGASGKSTLADQLGKKLRFPVIHLDWEYWHSGWIENSEQNWKPKIDHLITPPEWIFDSNVSGLFDDRFHAADTIIFLDFPRWISLYRLLKRKWISKGKKGRSDGAYLKWAWNFPHQSRPALLQKLHEVSSTKTVITLRSPTEVRRFLKEVKDATTPHR